MFLSWSGASEREGLEEQMEATLEGLELPGADSEWAATTIPSVHSFGFSGGTVELTYRDSVFKAADSVEGTRYSLSANGGSVAVHLFLDEIAGDLDEVLGQVVRAATGVGSWEELERSELETDFGTGRQVLLRQEGEPPSDLAIALIGLGDDRWVDLRMLSVGQSGHRGRLWDKLLGSLQVTTLAELDAFPVVPVPEETDAVVLDPSARRLLEQSRLVGTPTAEVVALVSDGEMLVREGRRVTRVPPEGADSSSPEVLFEVDGYLRGKLVPWGEKVLLIRDRDDVSVIADGELEPAGFEADVAAPAGAADGGLVIARNGRRTPLVGLVDLPPVGPARVALRNAAGEERALFELEGHDVSGLARRSTGQVLAAASPRTVLSTAGDDPSVRLFLTGAKGRKPGEIARWRRVDRLNPAATGWLVSGTPAEGPRGIYRVDDDGTAELLLSGPSTALALTDRALTFSTTKCLEPAEETFRHCVYQADLDLVRELGSAFQPLTTEALNRIAARVWPNLDENPAEAFPATRQAIADAVTAADEVARELLGAGLPVAGAGVDDLLSTLYTDRDLSDGGVLLLSVLATESLLRDGAVWEPATQPARRGHPGASWEVENAYAVGVHPVAMVISTLYEEDGWYEPIDSITERARGRSVVLGLDPRTLERRVRAAEVPDLAEHLREGRVAPLAAAFEAQPENLYLRETVYKHLAAQGRHAELADLAGRFAAREDAQGLDRLAWLAGRLAGDLSPEEITAAVSDLRDAIERAPEEAGLYLLLGASYERTAETGDPEQARALARACYRKVGDLVEWGAVKTEADEALARLEAAE